MAGRSGALSIKPSEGSRSRVRWTRPMDFQSIFGWKSLPEAGFGKNVVIDADRCSGSRIHLDHPNAGRSVVQDHSSDHRFKRLHLTRASVRRASGFVLTGNLDITPRRDLPTIRPRCNPQCRRREYCVVRSSRISALPGDISMNRVLVAILFLFLPASSLADDLFDIKPVADGI